MTQDELVVWGVGGTLLIVNIIVIYLQTFNSRPIFVRPHSQLQKATLEALAEEENMWERLDATNPISVLANKVGMGAFYPLRRTYRVSRLLVLMLPGLAPFALALFADGTKQDVLLMFAGAFFGTFIASFWPRYANGIEKFWQLAREQDRPPGGLLAKFIKFYGQK